MTKICSSPERPRISPWEPHGVNTTKPADIFKIQSCWKPRKPGMRGQYQIIKSKKNTRKKIRAEYLLPVFHGLMPVGQKAAADDQSSINALK
jgi:hypothetical protein